MASSSSPVAAATATAESPFKSGPPLESSPATAAIDGNSAPIPAVADGGSNNDQQHWAMKNNNKGGMMMYEQPPHQQQQQHHPMNTMNAGNVPYLPPQMYPYGPPPPHMMYPYGPPPPPPQLHPRMPGAYPPPPMQMQMPHHPGAPAGAAVYGHPPPPPPAGSNGGGGGAMHPPPHPMSAMPPMMYPPHPHAHHPYPPMMHYPPHPMQQQQLPPQLVPTIPPMMGLVPNPALSDEGTDDANGSNNDVGIATADSPEGSPSQEDGPSQPGQQLQHQHDEDDNHVGTGENAGPQQEEDNINTDNAKVEGEAATATLPQDQDTSHQHHQHPPLSNMSMMSGPPSITKVKLQQDDDATNMTPTTCNTTLSQISPQRLDSVPHYPHPNTSAGGGGSGNEDAPNSISNNNPTVHGSTSGGMRMMLYPTNTNHTSLTTATPLYHHPSNHQHHHAQHPPPQPLTTLSSSTTNTTTPQASLHLLSSPYDHSHGSFSAITTISHVKQYFPMSVSSNMSGVGGGNHQYQFQYHNSSNRMQPPNNGSMPPPPPSSSHHPQQNQQQQRSQYVYQYQHFDPRSHEEEVVEKGNPTTTTAKKKVKQLGGATMTTNYHEAHLHPMHPTATAGASNSASVGGAVGNHVIPPTVHMPNFPGGYSHKDVSPLTSHFSAMKNYSAVGGGAGGGSSSDMPDFGASPILAHSELEAGSGGGGTSTTAAIAEIQSGPPPGENAMPTTNKYAKTSPLDLLSSVSTSPVMAQPRKRAHSSYNMMHHHQQHPPHGHSTYSYPPPSQHPSYHHHPGASSYGVHYQQEDNSPASTTSTTTTSTDPTITPLKPMQSNLELMLSAANTLDIDESSKKAISNQHHNAKKRKLSSENAKTIKKRLLVNTSNLELTTSSSAVSTSMSLASGGNNLFSVGGYPPGFDLSTLPPTRLNNKSNNHSKVTTTKYIDSESVAQAQQALLLAEQALERPRVGKQLLLSMALVRTNPRTPPSCYPAHGTVLTDRFHWAAFPPLDMILRKNMKRYYELSTNKCQSRDQQEFNNELVSSVKTEAQKYGWEFDDKAFDDKKIRDRIRCFYKTHIQNAKKRLKTMLRHPEKRANIKALAAHFHLIEEKGFENEDPANITAVTTATTDDEDCDYDEDGDANDLGYGLSQSCSTESEQLPQYHHHQQQHHYHQQQQQQNMYQEDGGQRYGNESQYS